MYKVGQTVADNDHVSWIIVCVNAPGTQPVIAVDPSGCHDPRAYNTNGGYYADNEPSRNDLAPPAWEGEVRIRANGTLADCQHLTMKGDRVVKVHE